MATDYSCRDNGSGRSGVSIKSVAGALVVYTALYLAIIGAVHLVGFPDASAAIAPEIAPAHVATTAEVAAPFGAASGSSATRLPDPATGAADNSRECTAAVDTDCIYN